MTPRIVYDDDCGFCMWCVSLATRLGEFETVGFADLSESQRARLPDEYERSMHLLTDTETYSGGAATEQLIARLSTPTWWLFAGLRQVPGYPRLREWLYRWVADRRSVWGRYASAERIE